jgi:hypothetical protein
MKSGIMNCTLQYLPLFLLAMGGYSRALTLEITLENPVLCMIDIQNSGQTPNYVVQNCFMQMEIIECPMYENELRKKIMDGSMVLGIPYQTSDHWINTMNAGQTGESTYQVNLYNEIVTGMKTIFKNSVPSSSSNIDYTNTYFRPSGMSYYQLNVGNKFYPTQPVDINGVNSNAIQYNELLKYFNKSKKCVDGVLFSDATSPSPSTIVSSLSLVVNPATPLTIFNLTGPTTGPPPPFNVPFTTVNVNKGWSINNTSSIFIPSITGYYNVTCYCNVEETVGGTAVSQSFTASIGSLPSLVFEGIFRNARTNGYLSCFTLAGVVKLTAGVPLSLTFNLSSSGNLATGQTYKAEMYNCSFNAILVDSLDESWESSTYMLANTFKMWYDCDEYMSEQHEYFLDGIDLSANNQIVLKMAKTQPDTTNLNLFHYVDYVGALVVDKNGISILK